MPSGAALLCSSEACANQGFVWKEKVVGLQFHLESTKESIESMVENSGDDLDSGGDFVQGSDTILQDDQTLLRESSRILGSLIAALLS